MYKSTLPNGSSSHSNGIHSLNRDDLSQGQLKSIRQLVTKLKSRDGLMFSSGSIHELYINWSKLSVLCDQIYSKAVNYNHLDNQSNVNGDNSNQMVSSTSVLTTYNDDNNNNNNNVNKISQHNGLKSLIKIASKFVHHVDQALNDDNIDIEPVKEITKLLINLFDIVNRLFTSKETIVTGGNATLYLLDTYLETRDKLTKGLSSYWSHYPAFWLDEEAQWISSSFSVASSCLSKLPYSLMSLVSRSSHGYWQEDLFHSANPYYPLNLANYMNNPLTSSINWLSCKYSGLQIREIEVPRQKQWYIPFDEETGDFNVQFSPGGKVTTSSTLRDNLKPVKCRIIQQAGVKFNGNVIFHAQGGAFSIDLSNVFDQCFRHWVPKLDGAIIFDVVYSRFVRYPVQLQELLDSFLWLTNHQVNDDVQSTLGFIPKKLIFCGDSAGGLFLFSLATIIRDIQLLSSSSSELSVKPFPDHFYPKALITFYPVLSITVPTVQPSLILSFLDQFLTPLTILNCLSMYSSGVIFDSECDNLESPSPSRYLEPSRWKAFYNTWLGREKTWLGCDKTTLDQRIDKISRGAITPYKSPLICYDLEKVKDLNVYLIVGEFDPFLDTNIEFTQKWPGKVTLDVLDDLGHGFLALTWTSKRSRNAARICLNRIKEAFSD